MKVQRGFRLLVLRLYLYRLPQVALGLTGDDKVVGQPEFDAFKGDRELGDVGDRRESIYRVFD